MKNITQQVDIGLTFGQNFNGSLPPLTLGNFITIILPQIYTFAFVIVLIYLVWGSYRYLISGGDPKAVAGAKAHLTYAIIGIIIIFLSFGIYRFVSSLLNNIYQ
jgi:hypothetical protein